MEGGHSSRPARSSTGSTHRTSAPEGAELVAALEEALLGAGIRGSLREQARALERSAAPPPRHRRLPSDPNAPEFAVVAAATLSPHDGAPQGSCAGGAGGEAPWDAASFGFAGPSPLGSRGRSVSMALLQPTVEEEEAPQGRQRARDRRYSVEVTGTGAARVSVPGLARGAQAAAAVQGMSFLDWEKAQAEHHTSLAREDGAESGSGEAADQTGDEAAAYGSGSDDLEVGDGSQGRVAMFGAPPRRTVGSVASDYDERLGPGQEAYMDDEGDEHEHEDDDGMGSDEDGGSWDGGERRRESGGSSSVEVDDARAGPSGDALDRDFGMPVPPPAHAPVQRASRAREGRCRSRDSDAGSGGPVRGWVADPRLDGDSIAECATCAASPVRSGPGEARDPPPSPAVPSAATSPCKARPRLSGTGARAYVVTEAAAPGEVEGDAEAASQEEVVTGSDDGTTAQGAASASPGSSVVPVRRISSTEQAAVANRIQWERTVSSLDSLLTGTGTAGEDGNDPYGPGGSLRGRPGGDPLTDACTRASQRVAHAVAAARHLFSLNGMLTSPDAAPLRVAFKEAREFAEALASVQPAARRLLMSDLASSVADASGAAASGIQELTKHLQNQRKHCRTCGEDGPAPEGADGGLPAACVDVSGVVAGAKPLGEALHALMRWARNVTEFAEPGMVAGATGGDAAGGVGLAQLEAMSAQFTALFMRLALLWGALVAAAHSARRLGVDDWRWAHALEDLGKDQLLFVRSLSLQGFTQGAGAGMDFAALKDTVDATVVIVKALDAELSMATPQLPMDGGQALTPPGAPDSGLGGGAAGGSGGGPPDAGGVPQRDGWEVDMTDVRLGHKVGAGSYGQVFRATWRAAPVAVKLFDKQYADSEELLANVRREAALMARHRHPHVVLFMGVCTRPPNLAIVTEFCDNGSLLDVLKAKRDDPASLPWVRRLAFGADAARGLNYLHTSRPATIHVDLNTSNLLVDRGWRVKVGDFGLSRLLQNAQSGGVVQGTNVANKNASHLAPEVLRSEPYGTPSDVFSFGCVLWTLTTLAVPWERLQVQGNNLAIAHAIAYEHQRLELPAASVPPFPDLPEYNALIRECFQEDPGARPRMDAVLERLVHMQQRCIRRTKEDDHAAAVAAGTAPPTPTHGKALSMSSQGGQGKSNGQSASRPPRFSSDALSPTHAVYSLHRRASSRIAAAVAAAAEWGPPSSWGPGTTLLALGGLPLCTAVLAWCAARYVYVQKQTGGASA